MSWQHDILACLAAFLLGTVSLEASAAPSSTPGVERYDAQLPGNPQTAGGARIVINASADAVRNVVMDFGSYARFIDRFQTSKVIAHHGATTDVYVQVPILKGAAKLWAIVRFEPAKHIGDTDIITGQLIKGNIKRLDVCWHLRRLSPERTELSLELLIQPDLPVPDSLLVPELRFAAAKGVFGANAEVHKRHSTS
jgi:ribosome-associated toxin RatA of RatAB toxin-antitoxin module